MLNYFVDYAGERHIFFLDTSRFISDIKAAISDYGDWPNSCLLDGRQITMYKRCTIFFSRDAIIAGFRGRVRMTLPFYIWKSLNR